MKVDIGLEDLTGKQLVVFHYGSDVYDDIRPLTLRKDKAGKDALKEQIANGYTTGTVSVFPFFIPTDYIEKLREAGFTNWDPITTVYTIDLIKNKSNIESIKITSGPEQTNYHDEHDEEFRRVMDGKSKRQWAKGMAKYKEERRKYLEQFGEENFVSVNKMADIMASKDYVDHLDEYIDRMIKDGARQQYATFIPHLVIKVKKPLKYDTVRTIS